MPPTIPKETLRELYTKKPFRSAVSIVRIYGTIALVIFAVISTGPWAILPAILIIGALQHALSIVLHEAVHGLLSPNRKVNELVGNIIGHTIGFSLAYRDIHLSHHAHLGEAPDPDLVNYEPFPSDTKLLIKKLATDFLGIGAILQFIKKSTPTKKEGGKNDLIGIATTQVVIALIFFIFGHPFLYIFLWLLPLVTIAKGLAQTRNLAEHLIRKETTSTQNERTRTFLSNPLERFFIAPLNFNYHAEHHWYPMIPYYNLPRARTVLQQDAHYKEETEISPSYLYTLKQAIKIQ